MTAGTLCPRYRMKEAKKMGAISYKEQVRKMVSAWVNHAGGTTGLIQPTVVARWAIEAGMYEPRPQDVVKGLARDISKALRQEYIIDRRGRQVRAMHAVTAPQGTLWGHVETASMKHLRLSLQQRRRQMRADAVQLWIDKDYVNDIHPDEEPVQLSFNFENDVVESDFAYDPVDPIL